MSLTMALCVPSAGGHEAAVKSWRSTMSFPWPSCIADATEGDAAGYLQKVQGFYIATQKEERPEDVLGYLHADLTIHEQSWDQRVLAEFEDPSVAIVSFGGSKRHGTEDIYKVPYDYKQLARSPFISNLTDAEVHGTRATNSLEVAVVDSMSLFVRREFLDRIGGWPVATFPPSHCADYYLCLMSHRHGYKIRMVGVSCTHKSGGVGLAGWDYGKWISGTKWKSDEECHRVGHELIYNEFRDVLPVVIP